MRSHELAAAAQDNGAFETQIVPVFTDGETTSSPTRGCGGEAPSRSSPG